MQDRTAGRWEQAEPPVSPGNGGGPFGWRPAALRRAVVVGVAATAVLAAAAMAALWPRGAAPDLGRQPNQFVNATLTRVEDTRCQDLDTATDTNCFRYTARLTSGPDRGRTGIFLVTDVDFGVPRLGPGDRVVLLDVATTPPPYRYTFTDFQRSTPLWGLVAVFAAVVLAFGRGRGLRALLGLVASAGVLVAFIVPAILRNEPALAVALAGTVVIAVAALYLAHGLNIATTVALAGTLLSLGATVAVALVAVSLAHLTGLADAEAQVLRVSASALDLRGLLIAGIVVGALGVLDDVTVTQVSTVAVLKRARPDLSGWALYQEATRVGRDHIASTVNTLVLAYAGAALPLLLLFAQGSLPVGRILGGEVVAVEIVRTLVGSIGLVLSVPITTALAAAVIGADDDTGHAGHTHGPPGPFGSDGRRDPGRPDDNDPQAGSWRGDQARWDDFAPRREELT